MVKLIYLVLFVPIEDCFNRGRVCKMFILPKKVSAAWKLPIGVQTQPVSGQSSLVELTRCYRSRVVIYDRRAFTSVIGHTVERKGVAIELVNIWRKQQKQAQAKASKRLCDRIKKTFNWKVYLLNASSATLLTTTWNWRKVSKKMQKVYNYYWSKIEWLKSHHKKA